MAFTQTRFHRFLKTAYNADTAFEKKHGSTVHSLPYTKVKVKIK